MFTGMSENIPAVSVCVVDDDANLCRSMERLMRATGLQVCSFPSAEAFLSNAGHHGFDCLLLDVHLGGASGIELAERLAASGDATPVIFISAYDEPEIRARALAAGCVAYLGKSESGEAVLTAIRQACEPKNSSFTPQGSGLAIP